MSFQKTLGASMSVECISLFEGYQRSQGGIEKEEKRRSGRAAPKKKEEEEEWQE